MFLLAAPGENSHSIASAFRLQSDKHASSVPTHRKATLGLAPKRRGEKREDYVTFRAAANALKEAEEKREQGR